MGWGALMGLGQGLQQVGGSMMEQKQTTDKMKLADQLEKEKEERQESYTKAREDRQDALEAQVVASWINVQDAKTKAWTTVGLNKFGDKLPKTEHATDPMDIATFEANQAYKAAQQANLQSSIAYRDTRNEYYPQTVADKHENTQARTDYTEARTDQITKPKPLSTTAAIDQLSDAMNEGKTVPPAFSRSLAKTTIEYANNGDNTGYNPEVNKKLQAYQNLPDRADPSNPSSGNKEMADGFANALKKGAMAVINGTATQSEVEAQFTKAGYPQLAKALANAIRALRAEK